MSQKTIWTSILILAVVASAALILISNVTNQVLGPTKPQPDAFMTGVIGKNFNQEGKLQSILRSPEMIHFPLNNSTDITTPHVIFYSNKGSPWDLKSIYGKANFGINQIIMWKNVSITRKKSKENSSLNLQTSEITVYPHLQFATTNRKVIIKEIDSVVHSTGLRANLKTGIIHLINQAKGIYDPNQDNVVKKQ